MKCPYCGSLKFGKIELENTKSYVITQIDLSTNPPRFLPDTGILIDLLGCNDCGGMLPYSEKLIIK